MSGNRVGGGATPAVTASVDEPAVSADGIAVSVRALAGGAVLTVAGGVIDAGFTFGFTLLITHRLGAAGSGPFFEALAIFTILTLVLQLGAGSTVVRSISASLATEREAELAPLVIGALIPPAIAATLAGACLFLLAPHLAPLLVSHGDPHSEFLYLRILAPFVVVGSLVGILLAATRGFGRMGPTVLLDRVTEPVVRVVLVALLPSAALSPIVIGLAWAGPLGFTFVCSALVVLGLVRLRSPAHPLSERRVDWRGLVRGFWRFTTPQWLSDVFQVAVLSVDVVLVGSLASSREAGIYAAISKVVGVGFIAFAAVLLVLGPALGAAFARKDLVTVRLLYGLATASLAALSVPVFLTMAANAPLIARIFGHGFSTGGSPLTILALGMLVDVLAGPALLALLMGGKSRLVLVDSAVAFSVNIALNIALIPSFGMVGAACAWAASVVIINLLALIQIRKLWVVTPFDRVVLRMALAAFVCYGGGSLAERLLGNLNVRTFAITLALETAIYIGLLWRLGAGDLVDALLLDGRPERVSR